MNRRVGRAPAYIAAGARAPEPLCLDVFAMSFSVVIATWNRSRLLEAAVRSALTQTLPPSEVLVCDDGSTDDSESRIMRIGDPRVRWIPGTHAGRAAPPRNRGISAARGEWLAFLDSDDRWQPDKLEKQARALRDSDCKAATANAFDHRGERTQPAPYLSIRRSKISFTDLARVNEVISSCAVVHRDILQRTGSFPEDKRFVVGEDYALWLRVASFTSFAYVPECLALYSNEPESSLRSVHADENLLRNSVFESYIAWALKARPAKSASLIRCAARELLRARWREKKESLTRLLSGYARHRPI